MNLARQISRRFGRTMGARTRSVADYSITATISVVPDPLKSRNRVVVEYALKNVNQPIAVSTYELEKMGLASPKTITDGLTRLLEK